MVNHLTDDYGRVVIAYGMPSSREWCKCRYPKLISELSSLHGQAAAYHLHLEDEMVRLLMDAGVDSKMKVESIVEALLENCDLDQVPDKLKWLPDWWLREWVRRLKVEEQRP